jgi:ketopantoate reductase
MWLSSVLKNPGEIVVRHVQRGYPLKEIFPEMKNHADQLRKSIEPSCISPKVDSIKSELYIKAINSLAFNMVALDTEFNNLQLKENKNSVITIKKIMQEGEQIPLKLHLPVPQSIDERINQTLSSTAHTMSMLNDYKIGKKPELNHLWESFESLCKIIDIHMDFTESLYQKIVRKIYLKRDKQ